MCFICMNSFNLATSLTKNTNIFMFYIKKMRLEKASVLANVTHV